MTLGDFKGLIKTGIISGNLIHGTLGILVAIYFGYLNLQNGILFLLGLILVIASACVANNFIDKKSDAKMERTKNRYFVRNPDRVMVAVGLSGSFLVLGLASLYFVNVVTLLCAIVAWVFYVIVYGYYKRKTVYNTFIGAIPGAIPGLAGYTALTSELDAVAIVIFTVLFFWQIPHFYAISIFRKKEYEMADFPVVSHVFPEKKVILVIKFYIVVYTVFTLFLALLMESWIIFIAFLAAGSWWLSSGVVRKKQYKVAVPKLIFVRSLMVSVLNLVILLLVVVLAVFGVDVV